MQENMNKELLKRTLGRCALYLEVLEYFCRVGIAHHWVWSKVVVWG